MPARATASQFLVSIHALHAESDKVSGSSRDFPYIVSIHALHAESDA